jgi:hypothetical protein
MAETAGVPRSQSDQHAVSRPVRASAFFVGQRCSCGGRPALIGGTIATQAVWYSSKGIF